MTTAVLLPLLAATIAIGPMSTDAGSIQGIWRTESDGGATVHLTACGEAICGHVVTSPRLRAHPDQRDSRNRDISLRDRPLKGLLMLKLRPLGPGRWGDGWVYNPEDGGTYHGAAELRPDGALRLRGCIVAPFCRSQTWTRVN